MAGPIPLFGTWSIQFWYRASAAPSDLHFLVTLRHPDGRLEERLQSITSFTTDRTTNRVIVVPNGTGNAEIVDAVVTGNFATMKRGQFYVVGFIIPRPFGQYAGDDEYGRRFLRGYLYENHNVVLGDDVEPGPGGGEGFIRTVTGTNPAAAAEVSEAVPANATWKLLHFSVVCAQGATQTPRVILVCDDGAAANRVFVTGQANAQSADTTRTWIFPRGATLPDNSAYLGFAAAAVDTDSLLEGGRLPNDGVLLVEGDRIRTATQGIGANTNFAAPIFEVEEWLVL